MKPDPIFRHAVIIAYVLLAMLVAALILLPPENSGDVAAWVQGVGTIAAVLVAVWAAGAPGRAADVQNVRTLKTLYRLLTQSLNLVKSVNAEIAAGVAKNDFKDSLASLYVLQRIGADTELKGLLADGAQLFPTDLQTMVRSLSRDIGGVPIEDLQLAKKMNDVEQADFLRRLDTHCRTIQAKVGHIERRVAKEE